VKQVPASTAARPAFRGAPGAPAAGDTLWRLLRDYENTSRDEITAIRAQDFETVATLQSLKALLFAGIEDRARELGIDSGHAEYRKRLEKIAEGERANHAFMKTLLDRNAAERKSLNSARARVRALQHSYVSVRPQERSFSARG